MLKGVWDWINKNIGVQAPENQNYLNDIDADAIASIDPEAASILTSARTTVNLILLRREKLDSEGLQDTPLVIVGGETHDQAAHAIHHLLVLKALENTGEKTILSMERRKALVHASLYGPDKLSTNDSIKEHYKKNDPDGKIGAKKSFASADTRFAPYSKKILHRYIAENDEISVNYADATYAISPIETENGDTLWEESFTLDRNDKTTQDSITRCLEQSDQNIAPDDEIALSDGSAFSVWVRNNHMADAIIDDAQERNARYAFHIGGNTHVIGCYRIFDIRKDHAPEHSLSHQLKNRDVAVIAIPLTHGGLESILPLSNGLEHGSEFYVARNVAEHKCNYDDFPSIEQVFSSEEQEWVDEKLRNLGIEDLIVSDWKSDVNRYRADINEYIDTIKHDYESETLAAQPALSEGLEI